MKIVTVLHLVVVIVGIIAYTVLSIFGHDGTPILYLVGGYSGGAIVERKVPSSNGIEPPTDPTIGVAPSRTTV